MSAASFTRDAVLAGGSRLDIAVASVLKYPVRPRPSTVAWASGRGPLALVVAVIREGTYRVDDAVRALRRDGVDIARAGDYVGPAPVATVA